MSYITIYGQNLNDVSEVRFGNGVSTNFTIAPDNASIYAEVPETASTGFIRLISQRRSQTGVSSAQFRPIPQPKYYVMSKSSFDIPGGSVTLYGNHMSAVTGVLINNLRINSGSLTVSNTNKTVVFTVPSGNTRGYFKLEGGTAQINSLSNFIFDPNIPIRNITKTGLLTGESFILTGRFWVPELMNGAGGNNYYAKIGQNGQEFTVTRLDNQRLSGVVPTGAQNGGIYIKREDGNFYCNTGIKLNIFRSPIVSGFQFNNIYYPEENIINGVYLDRSTGLKYKTDVAVDYEWTTYSGNWRVSNNGSNIIFPSSGFSKALNEYVSGFNIATIEMAVMYPEGSGLLLYDPSPSVNKAFFYEQDRGLGSQSYTRLYFTGLDTFNYGSFFTGSGNVQRRYNILNSSPYGWWVEYRLSGYSGLNWYATGVLATGLATNDTFGYGLPRTIRINAGAISKTLYLGISGWPTIGSGILQRTSYSGLATGFIGFEYTYVCQDGFISGASGFIAFRR